MFIVYLYNRRLNKSFILYLFLFLYSTTDAIFVLHAVLSSSLESFNGACCGFIDFTKAFDKINRDILFKRLKQFHISAKLLNMIKNMYSKLGCQ